MAEVTIIAPNVVEFVGNLARQAAPTPVPTPPPPPPTQPDRSARARDDAGGQSRQLAANQNAPRQAPRVPRSTAPGGFNLTGNGQRRPAQPSTQFLAQQIAQESTKLTRAPAAYASAAGAYEKSRGGRPRTETEPIIITRSVDRRV